MKTPAFELRKTETGTQAHPLATLYLVDDLNHPRVTYEIAGVDVANGRLVRLYVQRARTWRKH